jgi:hypothetical protein
MPLQLLAAIVLGLMCGSEMNVALFGHPTLIRTNRGVPLARVRARPALKGGIPTRIFLKLNFLDRKSQMPCSPGLFRESALPIRH